MNFTLLRILIIAVFVETLTFADPLRIHADSSSREVYACSGSMLAGTSGEFKVSYYDYNGTGTCLNLRGESSIIWAFRLPAIPLGKEIKSASFHVYYLTCFIKDGIIRYGLSESLYGIGHRPGVLQNPITASDSYVGPYGGDKTDCVPIQSDWINLEKFPAWQQTNADGSAQLSSFLQSQYWAGAKPGDWIFLRQNGETRPAVTTRNNFANCYFSDGSYNAYIEYELIDTNSLQTSPEITPNMAPVMAPIQHQPYYLHERELFGYSPRFFVNSPCFDVNNRPYIRAEYEVQTLNNEGKWVGYDLKTVVKARYPNWNERWIYFGPNSEDRIVFDDDNDAYLIIQPDVYSDINVIDPILLLYSRDQCRTWQSYVLPPQTGSARLQFRDTFNDMSRPPAIVVRTERTSGGQYIDLITPIKNSNGTLTIPTAVNLNAGPGDQYASCLGGGLNSDKGAANLSVTKGNYVHIVYPGRYQVNNEPGTPQYIVTYSYITNSVIARCYLGSAGRGEPDSHNWPGITLDSQGYLHVILGAHGMASGQCFKYTRSISPNSISSGMTTPQNLESGFTYVSLVCDRNDTLQLVARHHWDPVQCIKHQRKPYNQAWTSRVPLVIPWNDVWPDDGPYMHPSANLNIDRKNRLFLYYSTFRFFERPAQVTAYNYKHPCAEGIEKQQSPAILVSDNGGISWRLCTTDDFYNGISNE